MRLITPSLLLASSLAFILLAFLPFRTFLGLGALPSRSTSPPKLSTAIFFKAPRPIQPIVPKQKAPPTMPPSRGLSLNIDVSLCGAAPSPRLAVVAPSFDKKTAGPPKTSRADLNATAGSNKRLLPEGTATSNGKINANRYASAGAHSEDGEVKRERLQDEAHPTPHDESDKGEEAQSRKLPILKISAALCNGTFLSKGVSGKSARYHERFAPLRPMDRGQLDALQRRRLRAGEESSEEPFPGPRQTPIPIEPPSWAVAAPGEARLEPICESLGSQTPVDLTLQPCYTVGRSPGSDVQLLHATSSRKHALIFHHPNGNCYVVDCGSAHGTYVNGIRVRSAIDTQEETCTGCSTSSMVMPYRVRRGALVRFGGPGAPCFVLKSFSRRFESLVEDLGISTSAPEDDSLSSPSLGVQVAKKT